jgi:hypothetical protein
MKAEFKSKRPPSPATRGWSSIYLPEKTIGTLRAFCDARGITLTSAVQVAIAEMIEKHDTAAVTP